MKRQEENFRPMDWKQESPDALLARIRIAGVVGMGGAGFPTHLKLQAALACNSRTIVANGVETDPGVTADKTLLQQKGEDVLEGIRIAARTIGASSCILAVSDPSTASRLEECNESGIEIAVLENDYQNGEERVLIELLTGEKVSRNTYPAHLGIAVLNVATLFAICECVRDGLPLSRRIVTVLGEDQWCEFDTPIHELAKTEEKLRVGSFANGRTVKSGDVLQPVHSAISLDQSVHSLPCIRCGWCDAACPLDLPVQELLDEAKRDISASSLREHVVNCNDCGACVVSCPSQIPIIDHLRKFRERENEAQIADQRARAARQRFEAKQQRIVVRDQRTMDQRERRMQQDHKWQ